MTGVVRRTARERIAVAAFAVYLVGTLSLNRQFSTIGVPPLYLADLMLLLSATAYWGRARSATAVRPWLALAVTALGVLALQSVARGLSAGYPFALKGMLLGIYPCLAVLVASVVAGRLDLVRSFAQRLLPAALMGCGAAVVLGISVIPSAMGLTVAAGAAFCTYRGLPRRRLVLLSLGVGTVLITVTGSRGPALMIAAAALAAAIASAYQPSRATGQRMFAPSVAVALCALVAFSGALALLNSTGGERLAVPGAAKLTARLADTFRPGTQAANNVEIRLEMWSYALLATAEQHPFLGLGAGHPVEVQYRGLNLADEPTGVHNSFIGYVFYLGYPAGLLVLLIVGAALRRSWQLRGSEFGPPLFGLVIAATVACLTNVALETPYLGGPIWLALAWALVAPAPETAGRHQPDDGAPARSDCVPLLAASRAA